MSGAASSMLRLSGASVRLGTVTALQHVSLDVRRGEFIAVIGANGSGKTTLLRLLLGLINLLIGAVQRRGGSPQAVAA